jgi:chloride channel 3/4/5
MLTKTVVPSSISLTTLDENLGAEARGTKRGTGTGGSGSPSSQTSPHGTFPNHPPRPAMIYYSAAGSGVAEVKVINSGFVLHGYLGLKTLVVKTIALVFSVASGLSLGKEGPYVHIATCVGNICCRLFAKYNQNDGKRREVLSASAASGVAVAFGAPIGGVLFSLEEVSYYFPPKTLFRTFFCCIAAALSLKFLNPYGTGKIVLFQVRYNTDWEIFEIIIFVFLGVLGGALGAFFIKASSWWARNFRRIPAIKRWPMLEVFLVAVLTGLVSFWNRYTKLPVTELLFELASPCEGESRSSTGLCPREDGIVEIIQYLLVAFVIKSFLTVVTFGIKVPAGIYVPSMVVGGLMGRIVGHAVQYWVAKNPTFFLFDSCPNVAGMESCITPGVYAMVAAGATMCGVTRLSVTLAVILFELTGSLDHVLPFSLSVLCAKWTADAIEPRSIYVRILLLPSGYLPQHTDCV